MKKPTPKLTNARIECDVEEGHCACGAFHTMPETIWRKKKRAVMDLAVEIEEWRRQVYMGLSPKTASQVWFVSHLLRLYVDQMDDEEAFREVVGDTIRRTANGVSNGDGFDAGHLPSIARAAKSKAKLKAQWAALARRLDDAEIWIRR